MVMKIEKFSIIKVKKTNVLQLLKKIEKDLPDVRWHHNRHEKVSIPFANGDVLYTVDDEQVVCLFIKADKITWIEWEDLINNMLEHQNDNNGDDYRAYKIYAFEEFFPGTKKFNLK
jgi:hypothetical protein